MGYFFGRNLGFLRTCQSVAPFGEVEESRSRVSSVIFNALIPVIFCTSRNVFFVYFRNVLLRKKREMCEIFTDAMITQSDEMISVSTEGNSSISSRKEFKIDRFFSNDVSKEIVREIERGADSRHRRGIEKNINCFCNLSCISREMRRPVTSLVPKSLRNSAARFLVEWFDWIGWQAARLYT